MEVTANKIVVNKDGERWEIIRSEGTRTKGTPKVGDKVTIQYKMIAHSIEVQSATKAK